MPGGITRLLACDAVQLASYKGLHLGNTFVHSNYGKIAHRRVPPEGETQLPTGARQTDGSPSYNKPGSIMRWLEDSPEALDVDYVLYIDADMLLRQPMDPVAMGVRPGVVVSEHVGYLDVGIRNGIAAQFLPTKEMVDMAGVDLDKLSQGGDARRLSAGGWYHFFHISDIRRIAPRWFHYCREMRTNPQKYWRIVDKTTGLPSIEKDIVTGDAYVGRNQAPWISEMYGYVFSAAEAGVRHILTDGVVVYPDEVGASRPDESSILHYGLHCNVGDFSFTKYSFHGFDAMGCTGKTFGDPPAPRHVERLCAETVLTLNDAMCDFYNRPPERGGCGRAPAVQCPSWEKHGPRTCNDQHQECNKWAEAGECMKNTGFMTGSCPKACGKCKAASAGAIRAWDKGLCEAGFAEHCVGTAAALAEATAAARSAEGGDAKGSDVLPVKEPLPSAEALASAGDTGARRVEEPSAAILERQGVVNGDLLPLAIPQVGDEPAPDPDVARLEHLKTIFGVAWCVMICLCLLAVYLRVFRRGGKRRARTL